MRAGITFWPVPACSTRETVCKVVDPSDVFSKEERPLCAVGLRCKVRSHLVASVSNMMEWSKYAPNYRNTQTQSVHRYLIH